MVNPDEERKNFIDFILKEDENELGLSHPSVEEEEKERAEADRIMMDAEADALSPYEFCDRFDDESTGVCKKIHHHGPWLKEKDGLNMQEVIDTLLRESVTCEDVNDQFQLPLQYLYQTGKFSDITKEGDYYKSNRLISCGLIKDDEGNWDFVNKLNTNWSDLAELLTTLFIKGGKIEELSKMNTTEVKKYLEELRYNDKKDVKNSNLYKLLKKYFPSLEEFKDFTYNTRRNTQKGDAAEQLTIELLKKQGFKLLYKGGNGDFIDMKYGIDIIMELDGAIFLIQVKSKSYTAKNAVNYKRYRYIDLFAGISPDDNGIIIYDRDSLKEGRFIEKDVLKENMDYLINKFYNTGEVNLGE